jgi:hypothetical protein
MEERGERREGERAKGRSQPRDVCEEGISDPSDRWDEKGKEGRVCRRQRPLSIVWSGGSGVEVGGVV